MSKVTNGISKIEFGALAVDGGPATTGFSIFGLTSQGTPKITEEDPKVTEFYAEEFDDPIDIVSQKGKKTLEFAVMVADAVSMVKVLGGTVTAAVGAVGAIWNAPDTLPVIEGTIRITPRQGSVIQINRGNLRCKINHDLSKTGQLLLDVKVQVLQPTKLGIPSMTYTNPA